MSRLPAITEIDISKPARALTWLRLTDYALVLLCGFWAVGWLSELVTAIPSPEPHLLVFSLIMLPLLGFAAYTGWRHVGVIDPAVWRVYSILFPVLAVVCLFITGFWLAESGSPGGLMDSDLAETAGFINILYIGCVALLGWISLMRLRRMTVPAMGARVDRLLLQLNRQAGAAAKSAIGIKRINKPRGMVVGAAGLVLLAAVILVPLPDDDDMARSVMRITQQISLLGFFLLLRARRYFQIDADSLLAVDRRPPILFLRSFDDDEKQKFTRADKALLDFSLETRLSRHFSRFGPFIAIGSPRETVPQLGAARVLLSDEDWQPRVLNWMREAGLIIMYSGKTHWVNWELQQVVENNCATRLILMFPEIKAWRSSKRQKEISARVEQVRQVFRNTPWEEELLEFDDFPGLRAMLFRPDGSMVMVRSRSRSRDSYHLAALIAHQYLLDPDNTALAAEAQRPTPRPRRSLIAAGAVAAAVIAALGGVYLFSGGKLISSGGDTRLTFKQGELYFGEPVAEADARRVGEYLVQQRIFSDDQPSTVQLHQERGQFRLRFVISPEYAEDPLTAIQFGILGRQIARDVLGGRPIEVGFTDNQLNLIKIVPTGAVLLFGKGELYFTEPVTPAEAEDIGELLMQAGYFSHDRAASVHIGREENIYQLKFVINPSHLKDPAVRAAFIDMARGIAAGVLKGSPVMLHLCDGNFETLDSERLTYGPMGLTLSVRRS